MSVCPFNSPGKADHMKVPRGMPEVVPDSSDLMQLRDSLPSTALTYERETRWAESGVINHNLYKTKRQELISIETGTESN